MSLLFLVVPVAGMMAEVDTGAGVRRHEVRAAVDAVLREGRMQADPAWKTWLGAAAPNAGWQRLSGDASLVGIPFNGMGSYPKGMSGTAPKSQRLEFKFECKDQTSGFTVTSGKVEMETHTSGFEGNKQYVGHMEGHGVEVFYEKEGDYERPHAGRRYSLSGKVLSCQNLELDIDQTVFMDKELIEAQKDEKIHALEEAGYSREEMNAALRAHGANVAASLDRKMLPRTWDDFSEQHDRQVAEMVTTGALKRAEDFGLVQALSMAMRTRESEEAGGRFKLGAGRMTDVQFPELGEEKSVMTFDFVQSCGNDPVYRSDSQLMGATSPANCVAGKRGKVLLTGRKGTEMASLTREGTFTAYRLVLYLEK